MICLDTNYLIRGLVAETPEADQITDWLDSGEALSACSVVWYEFVCGPVRPLHVDTMRRVLTGGILPFTAAEAELAGQLFNRAGRARRHRVDAMIAATAILADAPLATANQADFEPFATAGLELLSPPQ